MDFYDSTAPTRTTDSTADQFSIHVHIVYSVILRILLPVRILSKLEYIHVDSHPAALLDKLFLLVFDVRQNILIVYGMIRYAFTPIQIKRY